MSQPITYFISFIDNHFLIFYFSNLISLLTWVRLPVFLIGAEVVVACTYVICVFVLQINQFSLLAWCKVDDILTGAEGVVACTYALCVFASSNMC